MFDRFRRAFQAFSAPEAAAPEAESPLVPEEANNPDWKAWNGQLRQVNQIKAAF